MQRLLPLLLLSLCSAAFAADETPSAVALPIRSNAPRAEIHLWPNGAPGFESRAQEKEVVTVREEPDISFPVVSNIHNPSITPYLPMRGRSPIAAVIVAPGGAHRFLTIGREGDDVGTWLSTHGIAAFVLKYRLAREPGSVYRIEVHALQDAQRAIRLIRSRAQEWNINPDAVGMLGFSAGGEVAALAAMKYDEGLADAADPVERMRCRPDFQALIYPGNSGGVAVDAHSPPAFLACASDDRPDIAEGLPAVYLKFKQAKVPVELHIYTKGGHGFGIRDRPLAVSGWPARFEEWLRDAGFKSSKAVE